MSSILVVDDDVTARSLLTTVLGYAGHEVTEARHGGEALAALNQMTPALIIVDLLMPTMGGLEFVRKVRERPATAATPVIFYTASYLQAEAESLAAACGVAHVISKPAEPEQIYATVNAALGQTGTRLAQPAPVAAQQEHLSRLTAALSQKAAHVVLRLEAMIELGLRMASERDPKRLLADFCDASRKILGAQAAMLAVKNGNENGPPYRFSSGLSTEATLRFQSVGWDCDLYCNVLRSQQPKRLAGLPGDPTTIGLPADHPPVHCVLCVPIQSPQRPYGWLALINAPDAAGFSDEDEALAQILAAQVGRIYENGSLYRDVKRYAVQLEAEIVERKQAQDEIKKLNAELERRIEERTAELREANIELEAFGYTVSHDLRAPLRALSGYSSMMLESEGNRISETGRRYLEVSIDSARRMGQMVDDLLAFSRLGRQALTFRPVDMNALVGAVWTEVLQQDGGAAELKTEDLPQACGDCDMLREVWANLISNALKYSSKNPARCITIGGLRAGAELQYFVRDNGVGFDTAHAAKLFRVFERLHSTMDFPGSGAGLAIVDRIVRRHGGRVWAHAEVDKGATFYFTLPVVAE